MRFKEKLFSIALFSSLVLSCADATVNDPRQIAPSPIQVLSEEPSVETPSNLGLTTEDIVRLSEQITSEMEANQIIGLSIALVKPDRILWQKGFGTADLSTGRKVTEDTGFMMASVSKALTYTTLLTLSEQGLVDLDADINDYLPFSVNHPDFLDTPITPRMLMTHSSSIQDDDSIDVYTRGNDSPIALGDFMEDYFTPGKTYYNAASNFQEEAPGTVFKYSNMGTALAGYLIESIQKKPFNEVSKTRIFDPLNMKNTAWFLKNLNQESLAIPYDGNKPLLHYTFADYPNGQLRSSAADMSHFLMMLMNKGMYQDKVVLESETVANISQLQVPELDDSMGLGLFFYDDTIEDRLLLGHDGSEQGASTMMMYDTQTKTGVILLINQQDKSMPEAFKMLFEVGDRY